MAKRSIEYAYRVYCGMQSDAFKPTVYLISTTLAWALMGRAKDNFYIVLEDGDWKLTNKDLWSSR